MELYKKMKNTPLEILIKRLKKLSKLYSEGKIDQVSMGDVIREAEKLKSEELRYYLNSKIEMLGLLIDGRIERSIEAQKEKR